MDYSSVNTIWVLLGAALVFFMQAGFAMVETGFTRAKNAGNIIMKNLMDFCIGTPTFWIVGFGIMFGAGNGFFGKIGGIATEANYGSAMLPDGVPFWAFLIFQTVFCATSATIVSGAMAERTKFSSYCIYSFLISLIVYPVSGHWIWGGGFISQMGFHDFAGSCAVHMVGGVAAFIGAIILGPRIGKYSKSGKSKAIPGHNLTIGALGVFILWFCWFGFNGGSSLSLSTDETMTLSCACGQHPPAEDQGRGHRLQDLGRFRGGGRRDGVDILFSFFLFSDNSKHSSKPRSFTQRSGALAFLDSARPSCYLCGQDIKNTGVLS